MLASFDTKPLLSAIFHGPFAQHLRVFSEWDSSHGPQQIDEENLISGI